MCLLPSRLFGVLVIIDDRCCQPAHVFFTASARRVRPSLERKRWLQPQARELPVIQTDRLRVANVEELLTHRSGKVTTVRCDVFAAQRIVRHRRLCENDAQRLVPLTRSERRSDSSRAIRLNQRIKHVLKAEDAPRYCVAEISKSGVGRECHEGALVAAHHDDIRALHEAREEGSFAWVDADCSNESIKQRRAGFMIPDANPGAIASGTLTGVGTPSPPNLPTAKHVRK